MKAWFAKKVAKGTACGERILKVLDEENRVTSPPEAPPAPERPRELAFDGITFSYEDERAALTDFSARFRVGELAALVGRSGAGKSTAASLALRLFDPQKGHVRLDGRSLDELELNSMRERVGLCLQRTVLFGDTVRENMLLGRPEATDEEIWKALEQAGAAEFVQESPEGLDAELGAGGVGLSGGQMSRLALARTLLREARVLIVDEPFAGLDRVAAKRVSETLHKLAEERIVVVIAHDLENLELYDRIVFMERGQKVAEGSHAELLSSFPLYREVVRTSGEVGA